MKRGLKETHHGPSCHVPEGCKDYPDEKGTERRWPPALDLPLDLDARITPMKRGLKGRRLIPVMLYSESMQGLPR